MTIRDVIQAVINDLGRINVPVGFIEMIGMPVRQAMDNLNACIEAIDRDNQKAQGEAQTPEANESGIKLE